MKEVIENVFEKTNKCRVFIDNFNNQTFFIEKDEELDVFNVTDLTEQKFVFGGNLPAILEWLDENMSQCFLLDGVRY